jgi:hypothetical protein
MKNQEQKREVVNFALFAPFLPQFENSRKLISQLILNA